ncbi:MAG: T9SS type A sorting domain-containing protein [Candidatus Kariarchaeaceae archaeon]|jgi:hypothetical protein
MKKWVVFLYICSVANSLPQTNQFHLFDESNSPINVSTLNSLAIDSSNIVWIGARRILYKYDHGNWQLIDTLMELQTGIVRDIEIDGNQDIWFCISRGLSTNYHRIFSYNTGWLEYNPPIWQIVDPVKIFIDDIDNLWITFYNIWPHQMYEDLIGKFDGNEWQVIDSYGMGYGQGEVIVRNDTIFVTTWFGLFEYADSSWQLILPPEEWLVEKIWKYQHRIWVGGEKFGEFYGSGDPHPLNDQVTSFLDSTESKSTSMNLESDSILWIGTNKGHLLRFNDGLEVVTQYAGNGVIDIEIDKYNNKWILIINVGLLIYNEEGIVNIEDEYEIKSSSYLLSQNYPNPFNPTTKIKFQIPELSFVTLKVYDVLGSEVATLVYEDKPAGSYEYEFNAAQLPSGIYFYRLQAGSFIETKKMVLMK